MTPADFLAHVWPSQGLYALATPYRPPGSDRTVYAHAVFDTIAEAAAFVAARRASTDIFFCVHSLRAEKVWNPSKKDAKTGELGAYEVRSHQNMLRAKALFLDLDVGDDPRKYPNQAAAVAGLIQFCTAVGLPKPMLVSSGRGVHVYWVLDDSIPSDEWRGLAAQLKQLTAHYGLKADPMRTTDSASVLRVAGTLHLKDRENPLKVKVLTPGVVVNRGDMAQRLKLAVEGLGLTVRTPVSAVPDGFDELGSNTSKTYDGPLVSIRALGQSCAQVREFVRSRGAVPEPTWYAMIQLLRFVEDGQAWAHRISTGGFAATIDNKFAQLADKGVGPTSCQTIADRCGSDLCRACPHWERVKTPLVAARMRDAAPPPAPPLHSTPEEAPVVLPDPPEPFRRLKTGQIVKDITGPDGDPMTVVIYDHDLYPVRRMVDVTREVEQMCWCVHLPHTEPKEFALDAAALYRLDGLGAQLASQGIYVTPGRLREVQEYMTAYIKRLQDMARASDTASALGWHDNFTRFVLPDKTLTASGATRSFLTAAAQASATSVEKAGTLQRQLELLRFYGHPSYAPNQIIVLGSLAAPLLHMTGHAGVVVNGSGAAGASKSTSLYTGAGLWAHPLRFPLNGTAHGATQKARAQRMVTMGSLPVCVDEITHMAPKEAQELVMAVTQPEGRKTLMRDGTERKGASGEKSTIMICTANSSLHSLLAHENAAGTAGSMRVFEVRMAPQVIHTKAQADDYLHDLREHYGHVGELFVAHVLRNYAAIADRVRAKVREIDAHARIAQAERFWSATIATIIVAGEVAREMHLLSYDTAHLQKWALSQQMPVMRKVVQQQYAGAGTVLADYLEHIAGGTLVTRKTGDNVHVLRMPTGAIMAELHDDMRLLTVLRGPFKEYCARRGADSARVIEELSGMDGLILQTDTRRVLGRGTEYQKVASTCFVVNLNHKDATGAASLSLVPGPQPAAPARAQRP